jgi:hypothetical protein
MCLDRRYKPLTTTFELSGTGICSVCGRLRPKVGWQNVGKGATGVDRYVSE